MRTAKLVFRTVTFAGIVLLSPAALANTCDEDQGDPDRRIAACTQNINSGKWKAHNLAIEYNNRGNAYKDKGDGDIAISDYNRAINIDPKYSVPYYNRANAYHDKGDHDLAIADYNQAISLDPRKSVFFLNRGNAYRDKGDHDRAMADFSQAIVIDPKNKIPYNNRGNEYEDHRGDHDRAIAEFNQAISIDPNYSVAYYNRGRVYRKKGDPDLAIADFSQAISIVPKFSRAFLDRGHAYLDKGDHDRAMADFSQAISIDPKNDSAYLARGLQNLYAGSLDKALADLNQASALAPKYAYAALWVDIVSQRNKLPSRLSQTSSQIDMTVWPAPIIRLFMNQMTAGAVLAAADSPDETKKVGEVCEANVYIGEWSLLKGEKDEAVRLLRLGLRDCPHTFIELGAAKAELKALGVVP